MSQYSLDFIGLLEWGQGKQKKWSPWFGKYRKPQILTGGALFDFMTQFTRQNRNDRKFPNHIKFNFSRSSSQSSFRFISSPEIQQNPESRDSRAGNKNPETRKKSRIPGIKIPRIKIKRRYFALGIFRNFFQVLKSRSRFRNYRNFSFQPKKSKKKFQGYGQVQG